MGMFFVTAWSYVIKKKRRVCRLDMGANKNINAWVNVLLPYR